jgi:Lrp/AsnC family transcriptional regulator
MEKILDDADRRILRELQRDSGRTVSEIANSVGLSHAPCWRRIQRLKEDGYIAREAAILDAQKLGWETEVFVFLKVSPLGRANIEELRNSLMSHEQVVAYYIVMGNVDAMIHVVARNMRDYNRFYSEHLSTSPYLSEINSMAVLSKLKSADLPV